VNGRDTISAVALSPEPSVLSILRICASLAAAFALVASVANAGAQTVPPQARLSAADEAAARNWLRRAAQPLPSAAPSPAELQPLVDRLKGARVLGLGEATYGTHEDFAFKAALIKALVMAGRINAVAFEANYHGGRRLDAFIRGEPGTAADALRGSGLFSFWVTQEIAELLEWLRAWNAAGKEPIRVVGIDVQDVLRDTEAALDFLAPFEPAAVELLRESWKPLLTAETLQRPFAEKVRGWTRAQWETAFTAAQVLEDVLLRPREMMRTALGYQEARNAARAARLGLQVFELDAGGAQNPPAEADTRRDIALGESLLALAGAPARVALWAHDSHVARGAYRTMAPDAYNTGDLLADRLGDAYRVVGFAWRRGAFHALAGDAQGNPDRAAGFKVWQQQLAGSTLGALLARSGPPRYWVDLTALPDTPWSRHWREYPYERGWQGYVHSEAGAAVPLGRGVDVLVFFDTITPSRLLPAAIPK
jgi:erythromycin esterase